jgi:hypothetical protein
VSELHDQLTKLATRGTPRGADAVLDAARRTVPMDDTGDDNNVIPFVTEEPPARRRSRRPFGSIIAAAGVAATMLVGALAISSVVGSNGGAGSPESAVERLADAVQHGDPLAAADVLAPSEVASLRDTLSAAEAKAKELSLVDDASAPLAGLDLSVDHLSLSTQSLGDGLAKVTVNDGSLTASTHRAKFSPVMQKVLHDSQDNTASVDLAKLADSANVPTFVVAVREDGRWYVSAAYTLLEYVREVNHATATAQFGSGASTINSLGATSPDEAVQNAVSAVAHNDWDTLFSLVPPNEIPLYDYRDVLHELIQQNDVHTNFTLDKVNTTSTVNGSTASVVVHASGSTDSGRWSVDGGCFRGPGADESLALLVPTGCVNGQSVTYSPLDLLFGGSARLNTTQGVTAVEQHGRWFVSPMTTVLQIADNAIANLTQRQLYLALGIPGQLPADGSIALGKPVTVTPNADAKILTFAGHKGEQLLGLEKQLDVSKSKFGGAEPISVLLYGPDGQSLDGSEMLFGVPVELPSDGTYTFVLRNFDTVSATFTMWDAKDAPQAAQHGPSMPIGNCTPRGSSVETCSSESLSSTSGSVPVPVSIEGATAGG